MWLILGDESGFGQNNYFSRDGTTFQRLEQTGYGNNCFTFFDPVGKWKARVALPGPGFDYIQITEGLAEDKPVFRKTEPPKNCVLLLDFPEEEVVKFFGGGFGYFFILTQMKYGKQYALYAGQCAECLKKLSWTDISSGQPLYLSTEIGYFEKRGNFCYFEGCKITELSIAEYNFTLCKSSAKVESR